MYLNCFKFFWLITVLLSLNDCTAVEKNWKCNNSNLCQLDPLSDESKTPSFESQKDCRMSCGRYGAIWPMPTQECTIAHERVYFDPLKVRYGHVYRICCLLKNLTQLI